MKLKYQLLNERHASKGQVRGRYAPSPSGEQHLGNIQTAILAWLQARLAQGVFILRMDDIDAPRVKQGSAAQILDDLTWLGFDWDTGEQTSFVANKNKVYYESKQLICYQQAFEKLLAAEMIYACECSRKDIRGKVGKPNAQGHYVYPGTCRSAHRSKVAQYSGQALKTDTACSWRFKLSEGVLAFDDAIVGRQKQNAALYSGDFVIQRNDGVFAYLFTSVVDDIALGITDVVRGKDLLDSTPIRIQLFEALGSQPPQFWHVPLKLDDSGRKLAKRDGVESLAMLRKAGQSAEQIIGQLAYNLRLLDRNEPINLQDLLADLSAV